MFLPIRGFIETSGPSNACREDSGIEVGHMVFVRAAIKGGTDIVARLPVTLMYGKPPDEIESVLHGNEIVYFHSAEERPAEIDRSIPTKRTVEGYYAKEYNTDNNTVFIM